MAFEKAVLNTVEKVLKRDRSAGFTCGCLFVICDEQESIKLFKVLSKDYTGQLIKSGPIQGEYAYDFC